MAGLAVSSPYRWASRFLNWREPVLAIRRAREALGRRFDGHIAMNSLIQADSSFPAWLTLTSVWRESMDDPDKTRSVIGGNLCRLRERRHLSRRSLARLAGASAATLGEIEAGHVLPDIGLICRLAEVLDVPSAAFLAERP